MTKTLNGHSQPGYPNWARDMPEIPHDAPTDPWVEADINPLVERNHQKVDRAADKRIRSKHYGF